MQPALSKRFGLGAKNRKFKLQPPQNLVYIFLIIIIFAKTIFYAYLISENKLKTISQFSVNKRNVNRCRFETEFGFIL